MTDRKPAWVIVPVEATEEMAWKGAAIITPSSEWDERRSADDIYTAMLSSRPSCEGLREEIAAMLAELLSETEAFCDEQRGEIVADAILALLGAAPAKSAASVASDLTATPALRKSERER